jgi:hypothetical protein
MYVALESHNPQYYVHGDVQLAVRHNLLSLGETDPVFLYVGNWLHFIKNKNQTQKPKQIPPVLARDQPLFSSLPSNSLFTVPTELYRLMPCV